MKAAMGDDAGIERLQQEQQSKALTRNRKYLDQLWQTCKAKLTQSNTTSVSSHSLNPAPLQLTATRMAF